MPKQSAGILLYRYKNEELQCLLVHPGGPFNKNKELGAWSIPKGEFIEEDALVAAKRELVEEVGYSLPDDSHLIPLSPVKQKSGKRVFAWAVEGDLDAEKVESNTYTGKEGTHRENDKAEWFSVEIALQKINQAQQNFITELSAKLQSTDVNRG